LHLEISLLKNTEDHQSDRVESIRRNMSELVHMAGQSVHNIAEHLRPASLGLGIVTALRKLTSEFRKHSGVSCILQLMEDPIQLDEDQTVAIFRIVQESLTNVARHAKASCVEITLSQSANDLVVEVRDNGQGFDSENATKKKSFGLLGMRERAAVLGGSIDIKSSRQHGTAVRVRIPLKRDEGLRDRPVSIAVKASHPKLVGGIG
jgi:signal transduction histidine kinase